jgi:hypothetical protein
MSENTRQPWLSIVGFQQLFFVDFTLYSKKFWISSGVEMHASIVKFTYPEQFVSANNSYEKCANWLGYTKNGYPDTRHF